jgi:hypothetical protein
MGRCDFAGFYRWHLLDPIMFSSDLRVTIQQIGFAYYLRGQEEEMEAFLRTNPAAGSGWSHNPGSGVAGSGIAERVDDYCATSYVYCRRPQPVPPLDIGAALADIGRREYERPTPLETMLGGAMG